MSSPCSLIKTLLFKPALPKHSGRVIRFDENAPAILYTTGPMRERVLSFLRDHPGFATTSEIAKGIASNSSRTTKTLSEMVKDGSLQTVKIADCVREYGITQNR